MSILNTGSTNSTLKMKGRHQDAHTVSLLTLNDRSRAVCICDLDGNPIDKYSMPFTQVAYNGVDTLFFIDYSQDSGRSYGCNLIIKQCKNRDGNYLDVKFQTDYEDIDCSVIDDAGYLRVGKFVVPVKQGDSLFHSNSDEYEHIETLQSDLEDGSDVDEIDTVTHLWKVSRERVYKDGVATKTTVKHLLIDYIDTAKADLRGLYNKIKDIYGKNAEEVTTVGKLATKEKQVVNTRTIPDKKQQVKVDEDTSSKQQVKVEEDSGSKPRDSRYL